MHFCVTFMFFNLYVNKALQKNTIGFQQIVRECLQQSHLNISEADLLYIVNDIFISFDETYQPIQGMIRNIVFFYCALAIILLVGIILHLHISVCKPLTDLSQKMNYFAIQNGYPKLQIYNNEVKQLHHNFTTLAYKLIEDHQKMVELVSYISHDLKTPLTSILGYTQRLIEPGIKDPLKRTKYYETILTKSNDIKMLIEELDAYINDEYSKINLESIPIHDFVHHIAEQYAEELETYNIHLVSDITLDPHLCITIDQTALKRVFGNIISNAVSHGGQGITISLTSSIKNNEWVTILSNNGPSLEKDDYDKVFNLMYQCDASRTSSNSRGRGLGLTIVKQIIKKHNGNINAYRPYPSGFAIEFSIPIH